MVRSAWGKSLLCPLSCDLGSSGSPRPCCPAQSDLSTFHSLILFGCCSLDPGPGHIVNPSERSRIPFWHWQEHKDMLSG